MLYSNYSAMTLFESTFLFCFNTLYTSGTLFLTICLLQVLYYHVYFRYFILKYSVYFRYFILKHLVYFR